MIADVFRQALNEILYEDELAARARQQRILYFKRTIEDIGKSKLEREDERISKITVSVAYIILYSYHFFPFLLINFNNYILPMLPHVIYKHKFQKYTSP